MAPVIITENLCKSYKKKKSAEKTFSLDQLNLTVEQGEIYGFLGPNGAGKTTTIKLILGFIHPDKGKISVYNESPRTVTVRQKIGYLPEIGYYYQFLKAGELLDAYARLFHMDGKTRREKIYYLLDKVGLPGHEKTYLREFSKGMLQRFSLAQALLNDPDLLILDEPASGLDPMGRRDIREIILELHKKGVTVFFSSHELSAVEMIATRVAILNKGKLVREGKLIDLLPVTQKMKINLMNLLDPDSENQLSNAIRSSLSGIDGKYITQAEGSQTVIYLENRDFLYPVLRILERDRFQIESIVPIRDTLEDLFVKTVKE